MAQSYSFRKFINDVHLWLGLGSGIILFLVCFSGTLLVFEDELKELFTKEFEVSSSSSTPKSIEELTELIEIEGTATSLSISNENEDPYRFSIKTDPEQRRGSTFYVNQFTGEYQQEQKSSLDGFFGSMFRMHRWLLMDSKIGRPIVGIATIIFFFLSVSGLILWFPKKIKWKTLKPGFKIKFSANWKRINHDLHNTLGFYSCLLLIIMTLTGLCWSFEWYRDAGTHVLGTKVFGNRGNNSVDSKVNDSLISITLTEVFEITSTELSYLGNTTISLPQEDNGVFNISKTNTSSLSPVMRDRLVIDRDGTILNKEIFRDKPINVQIASLIKPIHTGEIFGSFSKLLYFIACLIATSLPVTGTFIWWNKLQKKRKKRRKTYQIQKSVI